MQNFQIKILSTSKVENLEETDNVIGDIQDKKSIHLATRDVDAIVHMACSLSQKTDEIWDIDVQGMLNLVEYWSEMNGPFIFISSQSVYGLPQQLPMTEKHPMKPTNWYGAGKILCEKILKNRAKATSRTNYTILRPSVIFADHHNVTYQQIGKIVRQAINGEPFFFRGCYDVEKESTDGISWTEAKDLAKIVSASIKKNVEGTYNFADGYVTWFDLVHKVISVTESKSEIMYNSERKDTFRRQHFEWRLSSTKIEEKVLLQKMSLRDCLKGVVRACTNENMLD